MFDFKSSALLVGFATLSLTAHADTRPGEIPSRSYEETVKLMKLGQHVRCSMSESVLLQTKEGLSTPDEDQYPRRILFDSLAPEASSPSDFATHSLSWENDEFYFYFFMNSQIGEIRIKNKRTGFSSETNLDLSDFAKEEVYIGQARLIQDENVMVTSPSNPRRKVPGERITQLSASCQFLDGYVP